MKNFSGREEIPDSVVSGVEPKSAERKLVESAQNGNKQAFGQLVRMHQKRLFRMVFGLTGSFDLTEDIVQESFIRAFGALDRFRAELSFYPWLSKIARNLTFTKMQREGRSESLDQLTENGFDPKSQERGPLENLLDNEGKKRFYSALAELPAKYREVFTLRHFEGMDYSEIASYLKIPPGTVDSRLHRARKMMMESLKDLL